VQERQCSLVRNTYNDCSLLIVHLSFPHHEIQDPTQDAPNQPTTSEAPFIGGVNQEGSSNAQSTSYQPPKNLREVSSHPLSNVIGNPREGVRTRSGVNLMIAHCVFVS
jgi:hypothetical protein